MPGRAIDKKKVAILSVASNTLLLACKLAVGFFTGSVSILSEAVHSSTDLLAALIAFIAVRLAAKPADKDHPYGHGKIENVSGVVEGLLIFFAAGLIVVESAQKLLRGGEVSHSAAAVGVMAFSALVNLLVSRQLYKTARAEESVAREADALHLRTDIFTSLGVAAGIALLAVTKLQFLDPLVAILVALFILREAWLLIRKAFSPLLDARLSDAEEAQIAEVMARYASAIIDYHSLRTRRAGSERYIDFHMTVDPTLTVEASHRLSDKIELDLRAVLRNASVNIHIEPGEPDQ